MTKIPKPPKEIKITPDRRKEYLKEWKRLFEAISPDIEVFIDCYNDDTEKFRKVWESRVGYLSGINQSDAEIFICFHNYMAESYLIGWSNDHMFSDLEIEADRILQEENEMEVSYKPQTISWKYWYEHICAMQEQINKSIPEPPANGKPATPKAWLVFH